MEVFSILHCGLVTKFILDSEMHTKVSDRDEIPEHNLSESASALFLFEKEHYDIERSWALASKAFMCESNDE